jgi:hypothetical protein
MSSCEGIAITHSRASLVRRTDRDEESSFARGLPFREGIQALEVTPGLFVLACRQPSNCEVMTKSATPAQCLCNSTAIPSQDFHLHSFSTYTAVAVVSTTLMWTLPNRASY